MSLLLAGLIFASTSGAYIVGRFIRRRRPPADNAPESPKDEAASDEKKPEPPPEKESPKRPSAASGASASRLDGFPCQLGDVLMRTTGEEAWLAGGLVLSEEVPIAALFVAPDAGGDVAIYARPRPHEIVAWLTPLDPKAVLVGGEPPTCVEHQGIRFDRARRLPLRPRRIGVGAPDVGDAVVVAEYASAGSERLVVLKGSSGLTCAFRGHELDPATFEVIASGKSTIDD